MWQPCGRVIRVYKQHPQLVPPLLPFLYPASVFQLAARSVGLYFQQNMKLALLSPLALSAVVAAHNVQLDARHANFARQNNAASASVAPTASASVAPSGSAAASASAPAASAPAGTAPPQVSWSLASVNPSAVSLSFIVSGTLTTQPTLGASTTFAPGTTPTFLPDAPPLPNCK